MAGAKPRHQNHRTRWRDHKACLTQEFQRDRVSAYRAAAERSRNDWRKLMFRREYLPYDCGAHGWWAIPCRIVACESRYSWKAYNRSGAAGPYQIMPEWDRPWPIESRADKEEHHKIAARLWNGDRGAGNWVCA